MNHGFFGFPAPVNFSENVVKQFFSSGAYTIQPGTKKLHIFAIGGGGGGGGGARYPSPSQSYGGGGGGGAAFILHEFNVFDLGGAGQTLFITVGAGGSGGAAATGNSTNGSTGNPGGATSITLRGSPGILIYCEGGNAGTNGTNSSTGNTGSPGKSCYVYGFTIAGTTSAPGTGSNSISISSMRDTGGAGGGAFITLNNDGGSLAVNNATGSNSSPLYVIGTRNTNIYTGATGNTGNHAPNSTKFIAGIMSPGFGGAGGGTGTTTNAGNGGSGFCGGGGGGGGAVRADNLAAGRGGDGGNGYVAILAI